MPPGVISDPKDFWNVLTVNTNLNEETTSSPLTMQNIRRKLQRSPNDYFWDSLFNLPFVEDPTGNWEEEQAEQKRNFFRIQQEQYKRFKPAPVTKPFKRKVLQILPRLDPQMKFLGRPSCSFSPPNQSEYCIFELLSSCMVKLLGLKPPSLPETDPQSAPKDQASSAHLLEGGKAIKKELDGASVINNSPASPSVMIFPDARTERIYHYVAETIECYRRRRSEYATRVVIPHLEAYKTKTRAMQVALAENVLGIRDRTVDTELISSEYELEKLSSKAAARFHEFKDLWLRCNEQYLLLEKIKKNMSEGCFDRKTLALAKKTARKLIATLKRNYEYLHACLKPVIGFYNRMMDVLETAQL